MSKPENSVSGGIKTAFWLCLLIGSTGAFFIWKDLADISQWIITSPREHTMFVWYYRWEITIASFLAMGVAAWLWWNNRVLLGHHVVCADYGPRLFQLVHRFCEPRPDDACSVSMMA